MKVFLITGGAGYIGSILVGYLLEEGHSVCVIDNFMFGQASLNQYCANENFKVIHGDIRIQDNIVPLLKDADVIIHSQHWLALLYARRIQ